MARKKRQILWHKKSGKFIPSSYLKPHVYEKPSPKSSPDVDAPEDKLKRFAKKFGEQIKKAARESR